MEFQYHGGNCISMQTKQGRVVIDDNLVSIGGKSITRADDIVLMTQLPSEMPKAKLVIADPGEYEVSGISIFGVAVRAHMDEPGQETATMFKVQFDDLRIAVVGHIHPDVSEDQLEDLGAVDVLFIPVGGNGYTLDGIGALSVIRKIEPKIVILTHYDDSKLAYPVPQQPLSEAIKALAMEPKETLGKFKPKPADFSDVTQLIVLERQ